MQGVTSMQQYQEIPPMSPEAEEQLKALFALVWEKHGHLPPEQFEALLFKEADKVIARWQRRKGQTSER
jgi:hypothetical protein